MADKLATAKVTEITKSLRFKDDVGPLATEAQRAVVASHVEDAKKTAGSKVLAGGEKLDRGGTGFAPTVIRLDSDDTPLMREETFGPVVPIRVVSGEDEAIKLANDSKYGLTASVWTRSLARGREVAARSSVPEW